MLIKFLIYFVVQDESNTMTVKTIRAGIILYIGDYEPFELPTSILKIVFEILGELELPWQH